MTGSEPPSPVPTGPAWSVDLLADLHGGVLDADVAAKLRPQVESDPEALAVLAALEAIRVDLASLPPLRMPDVVATRLDAALRSQSLDGQSLGVQSLDSSRPAPSQAPHQEASAVDLARERRRRNRALAWGGGLLAIAAAAVAIAIAVVPAATTSGSPQAAPDRPGSSATSSLPPLQLRGDQLGTAAIQTIGSTDYGPLHDAERLDGCLKASGVQAGKPLGVREIQLDGSHAVLIVLPAGLAQFRLVVVGANCGPGRPDKISDTVVGRR